MRSRRLAVQRLYWLQFRERVAKDAAMEGKRPGAMPEPYPDHCWNWWRAAS